MSYYADANKKVSQIEEASSKEFEQLQMTIQYSDWWQGEGKQALEEKYKALRKVVNKQLNQLTKLYPLYNTLQIKVEQAIEEKRKKALENRLNKVYMKRHN